LSDILSSIFSILLTRIGSSYSSMMICGGGGGGF
jgi:hypothetical protein